MALIIYFLSLLFLMMPLFCTAYLTNDDGDVAVYFTRPSYEVVESNGPAQPVLRLSRTVDCCSTISVWVYIEEMEARLGEHAKDETADYYSESHIQVLFPGGTTTAKFDIHMIDDLNIVTVENTERFRVSIDPLSLPYGVVLGSIPSAEVNIVDIDETEVSFDMSTYDASEGDGGVDLTLHLSRPIPLNFTKDTLQLEIVDVNDHTATTCDYGSRIRNVTIPADTISFTYNLPIIDDDLFEIDETFTLQIVPSTLHRQIKRKHPYATTVTVINDEEPIGVTLTTPPTIDEGAGVLEVTLSLSRPSPCCLRVYVEAKDIMAEGEGVDYGIGGDNRQYEVIIPAGTTCSSIEIPIKDDEISEPDEELTIKIMEESLPFGVTLGGNTMTNVKIIDNDIYLMFSSPTYEDHEHEGELCVTVTHDKPAISTTTVEILQSRGTARSGTDYEEGPYIVIIYKGQMSADYCINITNDEELEMDETFTITINQTAVDQGVIVMDPDLARVTIMDDEYTFCFDRNSYQVNEDDGFLIMTLTLSRALPFNISVKFLYEDLTAYQNKSGITNNDYYTSVAFPNFDTIPAYERHYTLNITIVPDQILENNELFDVTANPQHVPAGHLECSTDVIIKDDDDIQLNFESQSYAVSDKNLAERPVIWVKYPKVYQAPKMFPITIDVEITNITAKEIIDFDRMNYTYQIDNDTMKTIPLRVRATDDDIAETDEIYNLTIVLVSAHHRVITGINATTTMTIYNDDTAILNFDGSTLRFNRRVELLTDAVVDITYTDDQRNTTTITQRQAINQENIPLPVFQVAIQWVDIHFPPGFNGTNTPTVVTKDTRIRFPQS